jgi:hypothetical protein
LRAKLGLVIIATITAVSLAVTLVGQSQSSAASRRTIGGRVALGHSQTLLVWSDDRGRNIWLAVDGLDTVTRVGQSTWEEWNSVGLHRIERYRSSSALWERVHRTYGSRAAARAILARSHPMSRPDQAATTLAADTQETFTVDHYGTDPTGAAAALDFSLCAPAAIDGVPLTEVEVTNDSTAGVGKLGFVVYSDDFADPGAGKSVIGVTEASVNSDAGKHNLSLADTPDVKVSGGVASRIGDSDLIFSDGNTVFEVSASWSPTDTEWATIAADLTAGS